MSEFLSNFKATRCSTARILLRLFIITVNKTLISSNGILRYSMLKIFSCYAGSMAKNLEYVGGYAPFPRTDFDWVGDDASRFFMFM